MSKRYGGGLKNMFLLKKPVKDYFPLTPLNSYPAFSLKQFLLRSQLFILGTQYVFTFFMIWVRQTAVYRADFNALWLIIVPNTLCTEFMVNFINFIPLIDCLIGALWFTHIAVDAFVCNI
jgi:hypothetical protein